THRRDRHCAPVILRDKILASSTGTSGHVVFRGPHDSSNPVVTSGYGQCSEERFSLHPFLQRGAGACRFCSTRRALWRTSARSLWDDRGVAPDVVQPAAIGRGTQAGI